MARPALLEILTRIAEPVVQSKGLEIWGIEVLQGSRPLVRLFVDTPPSALAAQQATLASVPIDISIDDPTAEQNADHDADQDAPLSPEFIFAEPISHGSVSIDKCAEISRMIGLALEVEDVFSSAYVLEVSSPGLSRTFFRPEQMLPYVGDTLEIVLIEAHPDFTGRKKFRGRLQSVTGDDFILHVEAGAEHEVVSLHLAWDQVRKATRTHVFLTPQKPGKKNKEDK